MVVDAFVNMPRQNIHGCTVDTVHPGINFPWRLFRLLNVFAHIRETTKDLPWQQFEKMFSMNRTTRIDYF